MADLVAYYAAIAGSQAPALVQLTPGADSQVRFFLFLGLRRTPKGSLVLFAGPGWNNVWNVTIRSNSEYVYDLVNEREVASSLRGYSTSFTLTLPEAGSAVVALPANQADFVKERAETRLTAHLASETAAG